MELVLNKVMLLIQVLLRIVSVAELVSRGVPKLNLDDVTYNLGINLYRS